jgi:hypothetical protein
MWEWMCQLASEQVWLMWALGALSAVTFVATLVGVPYFVVRMDEGYFLRERPSRQWVGGWSGVGQWLGLMGKNMAGLLVLLAGVAMLVLPGQGLLTMVIGLSLLDFPWKRGFERKLVGLRPLRAGIDLLRRRAGRAPLKLEP